MTTLYLPEHRDAFLHLLDIVGKETERLSGVERRLFAEPIDVNWVQELDRQPETGERLEAFLSRFSRLQDTIGDKLLPRLRLLLGEAPTHGLDALNRAEKLGWLPSVDRWMELRKLRNALVHEYIEDPANLVDALKRVRELLPDLFAAHAAIVRQADALGLASNSPGDSARP